MAGFLRRLNPALGEGEGRILASSVTQFGSVLAMSRPRLLAISVLCVLGMTLVSCAMFGAAYDDLDMRGYHAEPLGDDGAQFVVVESPEAVFAAVMRAFEEKGRLEHAWADSFRARGTMASANIVAQVFPDADGGSRTEIRARPLAGYSPRGAEAQEFARVVMSQLIKR